MTNHFDAHLTWQWVKCQQFRGFLFLSDEIFLEVGKTYFSAFRNEIENREKMSAQMLNEINERLAKMPYLGGYEVFFSSFLKILLILKISWQKRTKKSWPKLSSHHFNMWTLYAGIIKERNFLIFWAIIVDRRFFSIKLRLNS